MQITHKVVNYRVGQIWDKYNKDNSIMTKKK